MRKKSYLWYVPLISVTLFIFPARSEPASPVYEVIPGQRLAAIALGDSRNNVMTKMGVPESSQEGKGNEKLFLFDRWVRWGRNVGSVQVKFQNSKVVEIWSSLPGYKTRTGIFSGREYNKDTVLNVSDTFEMRVFSDKSSLGDQGTSSTIEDMLKVYSSPALTYFPVDWFPHTPEGYGYVYLDYVDKGIAFVSELSSFPEKQKTKFEESYMGDVKLDAVIIHKKGVRATWKLYPWD